jgi:hypothetical protein
MISAHTPTIAAPAAPARAALVRLGRAGVLACVLGWIGVGAAHAQHGRPPMDGPQQGGYPMPQREEAPRERFDPRTFDTREVDEARRRQQQMQQEQQNTRESNRHSRMTPDERRDLRRQINEAGMDLYPNRPRR